MGVILSIVLTALPDILAAFKKGSQTTPQISSVNWLGVVVAILKDPEALAALEVLVKALSTHVQNHVEPTTVPTAGPTVQPTIAVPAPAMPSGHGGR